VIPVAARVAILRPRTLVRSLAVDTPTLATWLAVVIGVLVRFRPVIVSDFPVNDGGMFYTIVRDIERTGSLLPERLSYNGLDAPFAYAPASFWLATLVHALGVDLLDVFRLLPAVLSSLALIAYVRYARAATRDAALTAVATFAFALAPHAYASHITGGGLPRVLAVLFMLLALERFIAVFEAPRAGALAGAAAFSALTLLSHSEMAWALAFSVVVLWLFRARQRRALRDGVMVALGAAVLVSPWLVITIARYGIGPFISAFGTGSLMNPVVRLLIFSQTGEPWFPLFAALALVGMVRVVGRGQWWLPAWVLAIGLLDSRSFHVLSAIPMALLAAIAVRDVLGVFVTDARLRYALAACAVGYGLLATPWAVPQLLRTIPQADRAAMAWASSETPVAARFLVVTERDWTDNAVGEWFPALADRRSVTTVQGSEWLPGGAVWAQLRRSFAAESCGSQDSTCLDRLRTGSLGFDYVYLPAETLTMRLDSSDAACCASLRLSLRSDPRYELVYSDAGALIFRAR